MDFHFTPEEERTALSSPGVLYMREDREPAPARTV
jgi:hypothetical protein